ncbi:hypothetical protein MSIMFI_03918 [Mycobacterium simulans]|nr:hypothetical protein MSIMFI_03918 [Mycobacterium simulans]
MALPVADRGAIALRIIRTATELDNLRQSAPAIAVVAPGDEEKSYAGLAVAAAAANARDTARASWLTVRAPELSAAAAADAGDATLPARTAVRAAVDAAGAAVAVGVAAASARFICGEEVRNRGGVSSRASRNDISCGCGCRSDRCSDSPGHH